MLIHSPLQAPDSRCNSSVEECSPEIRDLIDSRTLARQTLLTCDLADLGQEMEDARGKSKLMEGEDASSGEVVQRSERLYILRDNH